MNAMVPTKWCFVLVLILLGGLTYAQDLSTDLKRLHKERAKGQLKKMRVVYTSYETHSTKIPEERREAVAMEKGAFTYFFDNSISRSVTVDELTLLIDKEEKTMYLIKQKSPFETMGAAEVDSLLKMSSKVVFNGSDNGIKTYDLHFTSPFIPYNKITLKLNMAHLHVSELTMYYGTSMPKIRKGGETDWLKPRLQIQFLQKPIESGDPAKMQLSHYLKKSNDQWTPVPVYSGYTFSDQTQKP
ncbi:MAG: hypothetical protein RLP14_08065 [Owenweeksia sp.]